MAKVIRFSACTPVNSSRVEFATSAKLEGVKGKRTKRFGYLLDETCALRLKSASDPAVAVLQVFQADIWESSRNYRAIVLRMARRDLQEALQGKVS